MSGESNKDPLFGNKLAGAILAAGILIFGLPQLTAAIFGGGEHGGGDDEELHLAYCCVELETKAGGGGEAAPAFDLGAALRDANVSGGERRTALCKSCHNFEQGGPNGTGPNLWNVVGRPVASVSGFSYTSALQEAGGAWTYERLDAFLKNSQEYIPGTAMVQRFARDGQRAEILAYLGSLSDNPVAFPDPVATEAPPEEEGGDLTDAAGDAPEEAGGGEAAPAYDLGAALRGASLAGGERRTAMCKACHSFEQGGPNGAGPNLWNVVGRPVASVPGFSYTSALQKAGGEWTYDRLDAYLKNSQEYIPGTTMVQRFARDGQRAEILAYLASLSDNPVPFPDPVSTEAPAEE